MLIKYNDRSLLLLYFVLKLLMLTASALHDYVYLVCISV